MNTLAAPLPLSPARPMTPMVVALLASLAWTAVLAASLFWNLHYERTQTMEMAYNEARAIRGKDMVFRLWAMRHGGVYVPMTEREQPAKSLAHVPGRDIETTDGGQLTLRAPAIMVREMMDDYAQEFGVRGRITGLRYLNPANAPDPWEKTQLEAFARGDKTEIWEIAELNGQPHLRYLQAWFMDERCVKCHAVLGYQIGDMRGATGVNLPLAAYYRRIDTASENLILSHGGVWLLGLLGIGWTGRLGQRRARERARSMESLRLYESLFEQSSEAILVTDAQRRIVRVNAALERQSGYRFEELDGKDPKILSAGRTPSETYREMWQALAENGSWSGELWDRCKDGRIYPKYLTISALRDGDGAVTHYIGFFTDITERVRAQERLEHLAHYDAVTQLPNRHFFQERLALAVKQSRLLGRSLVVAFVDIDNFKLINDSFGHQAGDQLLKTVAERLSETLRAGDLVARLGGDEFAILIESLVDTSLLPTVAEKVVGSLSQPLRLEGSEVPLSGSVGLAVCPEDAADEQTILRFADLAMYAAKSAGKNTWRRFHPDMAGRSESRLSLEQQLRVALDDGQIEVHYQPQLDLMTRRITGFEALVRWKHPQRGYISPAEFIPVAEDSGLIREIGETVLRLSCRQMVAWRAAGVRPVRMAVNVSVRQLQQADFTHRVQAILKETGCPAECVELEITESMLMQHTERVCARLAELRSQGIGIAIDDFGTGYSSMAQLKNMPVTKLKIDKSFIDDIAHDETNLAIAGAMTALAESLGIDLIAEGVEDEQQIGLLRQIGCHKIQGYVFSRPLPSAQAEAFWRDFERTKSGTGTVA